jgi:hypothetical protein
MTYHELPSPDFNVGDTVKVIGKYAFDWKNEEGLRVCGIEYSREWRCYSYTVMDKGGFICDGWGKDDLEAV